MSPCDKGRLLGTAGGDFGSLSALVSGRHTHAHVTLLRLVLTSPALFGAEDPVCPSFARIEDAKRITGHGHPLRALLVPRTGWVQGSAMTRRVNLEWRSVHGSAETQRP